MKKRIFALLLSMALLANMSLPGTVAAELNEPANSTAQELICGFVEEHTHDDTCWGTELTCGLEVTEGHSHSDACTESKQTCELAETEGHTHEDTCKQSNLTCVITDETHVHEADCYTQSITCGQDEVTAHTHTQDRCYAEVNTCGLEEVSAHQHDTNCYEVICSMTEHAHVDACWVTVCAECRQQTGHGENCSYGTQTIEEESEFTPFAGTFKDSAVTLYKNPGATSGMEFIVADIGGFTIIAEESDTNGTTWYELDFDNGGLDSLGYRYVPAEFVIETMVEPDVPDESADPNACDCENPPENIANHTDGCPRKEYIKTQINLTVDEIAANWNSYDAETQSDILDMLKVYNLSKYEELAGKVDENEPAVPSATVSGAPDGFELEIKSAEIDLKEFGIENEEDFIAALDISLEKDRTVWSATNDEDSVAVTVDMTQYDIADGTVVRVHHQHDGEITTIEPLIIINSKLTFATDGFSVFVVEKAHETKVVEEIEGNTITMTVGEEKTFYWTEGNTVTTYNSAHFWVVDDPEGHIYPQVHSLGAKTHFGYHWYEQHQAPWITIKANKATPDGESVKLTMKYGQTKSEEFTLIVVNPEGLYIQDDLVDNGVLIPQGIEIEGVTFDWSRSDGQNVNAAAIGDNGELNVSIDRGGMTPSRTSPITYTVTAKTSDGTELGTAEYTVNYSTQIMNNSFENPTVTNVDGYQSYPNNYAGLYWKTTAPGSGLTRSMDVELMVNGNTSYLAGQAQMIVADGNQAAELNAEAVGTLYQDLLTTPGSTLTWSVSHAARTSEPSNNTMYIIVAATKAAQNITTATDVKALLDSIPAGDREYINNPEMTAIGYQHDYNGVTFYIWKHTATRDASAQDQWHQLSGSVRIPDGQYLTRFFFASDPYATTDATKGNLIDGVAAAEMLRYRIQYHIDGVLDSSKNQTGTAAVTTTVSVRELKSYLENGYEFDTEKDGGYIQINGTSHVDDYNPADKSLGLYITDYPGSSGDANTPILMDIYLKTSETELTITKSGWDILDPNQTFLFDVSGTNIKGEAFELTVAIVGNGSTTITGLKVGTECTVKEITEWSWRYTPDDAEQTVTLVTDPEQNKITFVNTRPNIYWLDGNAHKNNVFGAILKDDE